MKPDFNKGQGLLPVIIQHYLTQQVLMLGYMNEEAFQKTQKEGTVTFFSRSKKRIWTKGETSGNFLRVREMAMDCDQDTLLIKALPEGPTCHTGSFSCFGEEDTKGFLYLLENIISQRIEAKRADSYTFKLYQRGINKIAQKVGEEAIETVIEAKDDNRALFLNECADLLYHLLILLKAKGTMLNDIENILKERSR